MIDSNFDNPSQRPYLDFSSQKSLPLVHEVDLMHTDSLFVRVDTTIFKILDYRLAVVRAAALCNLFLREKHIRARNNQKSKLVKC